MTAIFTASNGTSLDKNGSYVASSDPMHSVEAGLERAHEARKEFYQQIRDTELGRWRSKISPTWTAVSEDKVVYFTCEDGIHSFMIVNRRVTGWVESLLGIAREYFDAHPERKPWDNAKPGETWVLTTVHGTEHAALVGDDGHLYFADGEAATDRFETGRRIWPEDAS